MAIPDASDVLATLTTLQSRPISILQLSEPISTALAHLDNLDGSTTQRTSDVSNSSLEAPTPASLQADLAHYRELFSKLRFSYVEQVTKEKFIRAIVGDPPQIVTSAENQALERDNAAAKAQLKALKADVAATVEELETLGRDLARRWEGIGTETRRLRELPERIGRLEESIASLRAAGYGGAEGEREMNLPLEKTLGLVEERKRKVAELDRQMESLAGAVPRKRKEAERLGVELAALEARRANTTSAALEARKRKEARLGGGEDDLEQRGRWCRAEEAVLKRMLEA
jgi:chromosome segregation ATPase